MVCDVVLFELCDIFIDCFLLVGEAVTGSVTGASSSGVVIAEAVFTTSVDIFIVNFAGVGLPRHFQISRWGNDCIIQYLGRTRQGMRFTLALWKGYKSN